MGNNVKRLTLSGVLLLVNCVVAIIISKLLNASINDIVAWMAIGACCSFQADKLLDT